MRIISSLCLYMLLLGGCGPKIVGQDAEQARVSGVGIATDDPNQLRYPLSGKNIDKQLYFLNKQETMAQMQNYTTLLLQQKRTDDAPNNYNDLQPRQASPFRW